MDTVEIVILSSDCKIPIPAGMAKQLNLQIGMKVMVELVDDQLVVTPQRKSLTEAIIGSAEKLYGTTPQEVDDYLQAERTWYE